MKKKFVTISALLGCVAVALADDVKQGSAPTRTAPVTPAVSSSGTAKESYPVIGYLQKRNYEITIKSSPRGTIYTVTTKDGKILHENVSAEQLKAQAPELYQVIKSGFANDARVSAMR
jgi:hypothetical protein